MARAIRSCWTIIPALIVATPATAGTLEYDCDTAAEHFSELKQTLDAGTGISGTLTARQMAKSKNIAAMTRVSLRSADGKNALSLQLLGAPSVDKTMLLASVVVRVDGKDEETQLGPISLMEALPFTLDVDGAGKASATMGRWRHQAQIMLGDAPIARITCSTGEFLYQNLRLGN